MELTKEQIEINLEWLMSLVDAADHWRITALCAMALRAAPEHDTPAGQGATAVRDDDDIRLVRLIYKHFPTNHKFLIRTVWKDSIDIDYPTHVLKEFLRDLAPAHGEREPVALARLIEIAKDSRYSTEFVGNCFRGSLPEFEQALAPAKQPDLVPVRRRALTEALIAVSECKVQPVPDDNFTDLGPQTIYTFGHAAGVLSATDEVRKLLASEAKQPDAEGGRFVVVPRAVLQSAIDTLSADGDEHGIAAFLEAALPAVPEGK